MAVYLSPIGNGQQFFTNAGQVLSGGKINTYAAGTVTPTGTWIDNTGIVASANPIILDSAGRVPSSQEIWFTAGQSMKFQITDSANNVISTYDNLFGIGDPSASGATAGNISWTPLGTGAVTTNVAAGLESLGVSIFRFMSSAQVSDYMAGTASLDITAAINQALTDGYTGIFFPLGNGLVSGTVNVSSSGVCFFGAGKGSKITFSKASGSGINISGGLETFQIRNMTLFSSNATNTIISAVGINDLAIFDGVYFQGALTHINMASTGAAAGTYGIHYNKCVFFQAAGPAVVIGPAATGFSQAHYFDNSEWFGNQQDVTASSGSGFFFDNCRLERTSIFSSTNKVHVDTCDKFSFVNGYVEEWNPVACFHIGSAVRNAVIDGNYFTLTTAGGGSAIAALTCGVAGNDQISFNKNFISTGTNNNTATLVDFNNTTNVKCQNNSFVSVTGAVTRAINSTCNQDLADISNNTYTGTFTNKSNQLNLAYGAKAWIKYNGTTATVLASYNMAAPTKNAAGDYTFNFTDALPAADFSVTCGGIFPTNGTNICVPSVVATGVGTCRVQMVASGVGTGGLADTTLLTVTVHSA